MQKIEMASSTVNLTEFRMKNKFSFSSKMIDLKHVYILIINFIKAIRVINVIGMANMETMFEISHNEK